MKKGTRFLAALVALIMTMSLLTAVSFTEGDKPKLKVALTTSSMVTDL